MCDSDLGGNVLGQGSDPNRRGGEREKVTERAHGRLITSPAGYRLFMWVLSQIMTAKGYLSLKKWPLFIQIRMK